jgi:hypothetical protein
LYSSEQVAERRTSAPHRIALRNLYLAGVPFAYSPHGATADIAADVWLAAQLFAQVHELVRAKVIVINNATPMRCVLLFRLPHPANS